MFGRKYVDWVGYETLVEFIIRHDILPLNGNMVEIGAFLGGGTRKLSRFLRKAGSDKSLFVVDVFNPDLDDAVNTKGDSMRDLYRKALAGKSQFQMFNKAIKGCKNVVLINSDSKRVKLPSPLCFGFVDGNHDPSYVENDFYLVWSKLVPGGVVAMHDYHHDLPLVTAKIDELLSRHSSEIDSVEEDKFKHILFVRKNG